MQTSRDGFTVGMLPDLTADGVEFIPDTAAIEHPWIAEFIERHAHYWTRDMQLSGWLGSRVDRAHWYYYRAAPDDAVEAAQKKRRDDTLAIATQLLTTTTFS